MTTQTPSNDEIATRAYQIYQQRGCQPGHELDDWLQAQQELASSSRQQSNATRSDTVSFKSQSKPARSSTEAERGTNPWEQPLSGRGRARAR